MKKVLCMALIALVLSAMLVAPVGSSAETSGIFTYEIEDGYAVITKCSDQIATTLTVPSEIDGYTVKALGDKAFAACSMSTVEMPDTVERLGKQVFSNCRWLFSVTIPSSVKQMSGETFYNSSISSISVDEGNAYYYVKDKCVIEAATGTLIKGFNDSIVPDDGSIKHIGDYAFYGTYATEEAVIPYGVETIGNYAYNHCQSTVLNIPDTVTSIGNRAFESCIVENLVIPDSVKFIGAGAFSQCGQMKSVTIPEGVETILGAAFYGCHNLAEVTVPSSVKAIRELTFQHCSGLKKVTLFEGLESIGKNAFEYCPLLESIVIPSTVTKMDSGVFYNCYKLSDIKILGAVKEIVANDFTNTAYYDDQNNWDEDGVLYIDEHLIRADNTKLSGDYVIKPGTKAIANSAFNICNKVTSITVPDSVTFINDCALYNTGAERIVLPDTVTYLGEKALANNTNLVEVNIPDGVTSIGASAFIFCSSLREVRIPDGITEIKDSTFRYCDVLEKVEIPESVTSIGEYAFANDYLLKDVIIPENVTGIGRAAFYHCQSLKSVTIPSGVSNIDRYTFNGCSELESVAIYKSLKSVGIYVFSNTSKLKDVYYYGTEDDWNEFRKSFDDTNTYLIMATKHFIDAEKPGDIDGDGKVTTSDALMTLKFAVGIENPSDSQNKLADIDGDGKITTADALIILKMAVGIL
ncbi:MAG: leucine-rich repeat protein [Clostridia bacterium]|nr:leucine-rich repeat protein [Clostridia bacterium]